MDNREELKKTGELLPVMEQFYTIQGEGEYAGYAAYFIRLAGCDVGCHWCDVKESWPVTEEQYISVEDIIGKIPKSVNRIIITGGEPLMYPLGPLTQKLKEQGYFVHLETSGAYAISGVWDWICVSPKKFKKPLEEVLLLADELKIIIFNKTDFDFGKGFRNLISKNCKLLVQPEELKFDQVINEIIKFVEENPEWRISLQTHKFLNIK